ncbi:FeoB-associated Cys-rich membrane protein [Flavobacterium sp. NRK F10]|uniref:FeoB-associated Cys-rich membrane protein n=1 Tax=Flavobacterium sediminis TaxID=2201181 RepID=A0A2U8QUF4_9FLAO|nr:MULTISPECIES: FeoB-associated Cys-rich membrane protein [Flavobacterium]AWM13484.1 FeoB-associated Cys-rich membrane protein [Flavobacterium sediminis]MCO6174878.1 FeoB-associated Cys-rich membrane protein [Flavobacterium sp. NRK F10]
MQQILVYITVAFALIFLIRKFFWRKKTKKSNSCGEDCNCH